MTNSVLIIDDSDKVREQIIRTLGDAALFDLIHQAGDGIQAFKILLENQIDLILCDLEMPRMDGQKFLAMIATRKELRNIPVIMLTGREDVELKIRLLGHGASDYVTKPFDAGELVARVKVQLKIKNLQDELKKSNEKLRHLSNTDPLTQIHNRRYMMETLGREMQRAERKGTHLSLIMMDIDHFKKVNDLYGHQNGDKVLQTMAELISAEMRGYDCAARYGGEEFVLIMPETIHKDALAVAERIRDRIQSHAFSGQLRGLRTTISMGVATYPVQFISSMEEMIREADEALYRAKAAGRNRVFSMNRR